MASFDDLGLRAELLRTLEEEDLERPSALQAEVIPALRRGGNLVARASTGAGKTLAYGLGVLDRLSPAAAEAEAEESPLRLLVLVSAPEEAERVALALYPYAQALGLIPAVAGGAWGTPVAEAGVVVAPVADALAAVRASGLKLESLEAVVVDGAAEIHALGDWDDVDALLDLVPRDAQRVLVSASFPDAVDDLVDRRVKRALRYPSEAALPEARTAAAEGVVGYVVVSAAEKLEVLTRQLTQPREGGAPPVLFSRTDERASLLAEQLATRGFLVGTGDDPEADVVVAAAEATRAELAEEVEGEMGQTLSYDVPLDAETLRARHAGDADAVVLVEPREVAHLREIARLGRLSVRAVPLPPEPGVAARELQAFRSGVRRALREDDLGAQLLVLEPLFAEFSAPEIAAALAALLRRRTPLAPEPAPTAGASAPASAPATSAAARTAAPRATAAETGPAPATWTRLYVSVGSRDDIRPGDLVGALAGEADIKGTKIGKIEIRDNFSIVEVEADVADRVIRSVNGTTIKGRSVRVDFDRAGDRSRRARPEGRGGGGARGGRSRAAARCGGRRGSRATSFPAGAPAGGGGGASRPPAARAWG